MQTRSDDLPVYCCCRRVQCVGMSIAHGTGRQTFGAAIVFVSYYIFALPTGVSLMFATDLGLAGNIYLKLEMWANAQRDGRPAEYRWRPLFNAAKFG